MHICHEDLCARCPAARHCHPGSLDSQGKTASRLSPCPIPNSLNSRPFSPPHTLWLTGPERSFCRISGQISAIDHKGGDLFDPVTAGRPGRRARHPRMPSPTPTRPTASLARSSARLRSDAEYCWVIDPIDGTRSFILGLPLWGTLIGLTRGGAPLLGLMDQPFTRERFWSGETEAFFRHGGATKIDAHARLPSILARRCSPPPAPTSSPARTSIGASTTLSRAVRLRRFGGDCYNYCLLALGHIDLVVEAGLAAVRHPAPDPDHRAGGGHRHHLGRRRPARRRPHHRRRRPAHPCSSGEAAVGLARFAHGDAGHEGVERRPELLADRVALLQDLVARASEHDLRAGPQAYGELLDRLGRTTIWSSLAASISTGTRIAAARTSRCRPARWR